MARRAPTHVQGGARLRRQGRQQYERERGSSTSRGYSHGWARFRRWFLSHHPVCPCGAVANVVHHCRTLALHPEDRLSESECQGLCKACHAALGGGAGTSTGRTSGYGRGAK